MSSDNVSSYSYLRTLQRILLFLAIAVLLTGCIAPKRASLVVPARCMKAESFTRPCTTRPDGKLLCDGVVATATCVRVSN